MMMIMIMVAMMIKIIAGLLQWRARQVNLKINLPNHHSFSRCCCTPRGLIKFLTRLIRWIITPSPFVSPSRTSPQDWVSFGVSMIRVSIFLFFSRERETRILDGIFTDDFGGDEEMEMKKSFFSKKKKKWALFQGSLESWRKKCKLDKKSAILELNSLFSIKNERMNKFAWIHPLNNHIFPWDKTRRISILICSRTDKRTVGNSVSSIKRKEGFFFSCLSAESSTSFFPGPGPFPFTPTLEHTRTSAIRQTDQKGFGSLVRGPRRSGHHVGLMISLEN